MTETRYPITYWVMDDGRVELNVWTENGLIKHIFPDLQSFEMHEKRAAFLPSEGNA